MKVKTLTDNFHYLRSNFEIYPVTQNETREKEFRKHTFVLYYVGRCKCVVPPLGLTVSQGIMNLLLSYISKTLEFEI